MAPLRWTLRLLSSIAPRLAGRIAFRLFRTTLRFATPEREKAWVAEAEPIRLSPAGRQGGPRASDGQQIAGWSWGRGPTVLLMHGWSGRASQMGGFAIALAKAGFRAIALDAPGHGASAGRLSSLVEFADTARLAGERLGPLHGVVAHSFGAAGTGWALKHGLGVDRLAFVAAPGDLHGYVLGFGELFGLSRQSFGFMLGALEESFDVLWSECRFATTIAAGRSPMLVVHDRDDDETHYSGALEIGRAWPESRVMTTGGLGHRRILRDPEVISAVVEFLAAPRVESSEVESGEAESGDVEPGEVENRELSPAAVASE